MAVQKMSYKDMAEYFTEHNKNKDAKEIIGVIVFYENCFKGLYRDVKYRSYKLCRNYEVLKLPFEYKQQVI